MSSFFNSFLIILLLILVNGLFVMSELAIVSSRKVRLQQSANQGDKGARIALKLANDPNNFLAAAQIGITLIAIISGAYGERTFSLVYKPLIDSVPLFANYAETITFGAAVLTITYMTLIFGELVPKRLALNSPESIARVVASPMTILAKITAPVVYLLSRSTNLILKLLGARPSSEPQVTEEEIKVLIEQGTEAGMFEQAEEDIMKRVFQLGDRRVSAIMTPRVDIIWLDLEDTDEENRRTLRESAHSRFPVCKDGLDNLLGVMQVYDLLMETMDGEELNFSKSLKSPVFVPESTRTLRLLELFKQT
jgi:putative hemolysin